MFIWPADAFVMKMIPALVSASALLLSTIPFLATIVFAQDAPTKCYVVDGTAADNSGYRCDNSTTGNSACCAAGATCYSNGLCKQDNGPVVDYLRVGCTDQTWEDPACLNQCAAFANSSTAGVRFCNGDITDTTSYCCDDGSQGIGSFHCCDNPTSIFRISPAATILAQMPLSQLSTTTTTSSSSSSTSQTSTSTSISSTTTTTNAAATSTSASPSSGGGSSNSAAIGAGVGVPVAVIALGIVGFFVWRHRRNKKRSQTFELQNNESGDGYGAGRMGGAAAAGGYRDNHTPPVLEAEGSPMPMHVQKKGYFGGREYQSAPQELPSQNQVHEIGT
ncbi:hypothetical protein ONS95_012481 [Cadophora gregata]|uniref:uncharacterized protein n=1 Tax=Cadophora gregata TaxID=51156 RepID=UPI0026DB3C60|nr:uncharacterized protein ONS95_012481 [Cadophora gregata]KAK0118176.1 hypothetical protein ONS95_012481 [Cadophora gregata]KAK0123248.1 hypothetical protein ONS96_010247 [Cadophora gregata f. sp. sojae]